MGSALSDPYLSVAAGMNGLAGPLHGLANQVFSNLSLYDSYKKEIRVGIRSHPLLKSRLKTPSTTTTTSQSMFV